MAAQKNGLILKDGTRQLLGVPHRDLTHDEVLTHGGYDVLVTSGIYTHPTGRKQTKKKEVKNGNNT